MAKRIKQLRRLLKESGIESLIIDGAENRFYLSGFTGTAGRILFTPDHNYFITDFRYVEQAEKQLEGYEIIKINKDLEKKLSKILHREGVSKLCFEAEAVNYKQYEKYKKALTGIQLEAVTGLISKLRIKKDREEISLIKTAAAVTDLAFTHILDFIKPGCTEREIALELEFFMKKQGAERNAFDFIVASGKRSSLPHGVASDRVIRDGDFITMDFGCFYNGYCSDMTRTIVVGKPTKKQRDIYDIVLKAQQEVKKRVKAGMLCKDVDAIARDIITDKGYGSRFGHGLGHGIGVEVHEEPRVSYTSDTVLEDGMVITDEPGIYIPEWGGVRIEDDLLITEDGCEVLNDSPRELISV